jgi:hypothetical protein
LGYYINVLEIKRLKRILAWAEVLVAFIRNFISPGLEPMGELVASVRALITNQVNGSNEKQETCALPAVSVKNIALEAVEDVVEVDPAITLVNRFLEVFKSHGVHRNEIPRCIPEKFGVSLVELGNKNKLIEKLTPELIDWVASTFNIRREWLEKNERRIYDTVRYYKNEHSLLRLLKELKMKNHYELEVVAYKDAKELDPSSECRQHVNLLIITPAFKIGDKSIMKYIPTATQWDWQYWQSRYQIRSIIHVCCAKLNIRFDGYDLDSEKMSELTDGLVFPKNIIDKAPKRYSWFPDDYLEKEAYEYYSILSYIKEEKYLEAINNGI